MPLQPLRVVLRRHFQSALRHRPCQLRTQSSSSSSASHAHIKNNTTTTTTTTTTNGQISAKTAPLPLWQRLGPLTAAANAYARSLRKWPYRTQLASALFIYFCSDISAQNISGNDYDPTRTARSLTIGAIAAIPQFKWFIFLSQNFNYSSRIITLATKVILGQFVFATIFNSYFFAAHALLSGQGIEATIERVKNTLPPSWKNSWKLWPAVTIFSFSFVPMQYRSVFAGFIAIGWQTYLAWLNRRAELKQLEAKVEQVVLGKEGSEIAAVPS